MEYNKVDKKSIQSWRIGYAISLLVFAIIAGIAIFLLLAYASSHTRILVIVIIALLVLYGLLSLTILPKIEYAQWGYIVEEDKVVIKHGIFWVKRTIIPIIRIQNITISQGPINRKLGLFKIEIALASGQFAIEGLDRETADNISENLKARLYTRIKEKGNAANEIWS